MCVSILTMYVPLLELYDFDYLVVKWSTEVSVLTPRGFDYTPTLYLLAV